MLINHDTEAENTGGQNMQQLLPRIDGNSTRLSNRVNNNKNMQPTHVLNRRINLFYGLTSSRSLWKKFNSLHDYMKELELCFTVVTETWFHKGPELEKLECDAKNGLNIGLINSFRTRKGRQNVGGGVSIVFDRKKIDLKPVAIRRSSFEIVAGKGKLKGDTRLLFVIGVYMSTRLRKRDADRLLETCSQIVFKIKTEHENPYLIIAGDFNQFDTSKLTDDFNDLEIHSTPATRGTAVLDYSFTNFERDIISSNIYPPLTSDDNLTTSDHNFVTFKASFKHHHSFHWIRYTSRVLSEKNINACITAINTTDFSDALTGSVHERVRALNRILLAVADKHIPLKQHKKRSTDDPWITDEIRKMIDGGWQSSNARAANLRNT